MLISRRIVNMVIASVVLAAVLGFVYFFYIFIRDRQIELLRIEAQNRASLFSSTIRSDIQRQLIVPRILSRDEGFALGYIQLNPALNRTLQGISDELDNAVIDSISRTGQVFNSSQAARTGQTFSDSEFLAQVLETGQASRYFIADRQLVAASRVSANLGTSTSGAIAIYIDFNRYIELWQRTGVNMSLVRPNGEILISSVPSANGQNLFDYYALPAADGFQNINSGVLIEYQDASQFLISSDLGLNGWRLVYLTSALDTEREINGATALLVFLMAFLVLMAAYYVQRARARAAARYLREGEELRALNAQLITEIEQRRRAERNLESAEQSLEQSSKLAVIGQMSAAVGHELNQPLAAMRTYLSGVRMLLRRSRFQDAAKNLNRIEDLITRMGSITQQMRSFARAHENAISVFDLNDSIHNAFSLMVPQLGAMKIDIQRDILVSRVPIQGDQVRVEQIIVNLLRNAIDAVRKTDNPKINIHLETLNGMAHLSVIDNGEGIDDPDSLFEPFYTTKPAGEGLGLGLAISASYAKEMGGSLRARNNPAGGAVFELVLPIANDGSPNMTTVSTSANEDQIHE